MASPSSASASASASSSSRSYHGSSGAGAVASTGSEPRPSSSSNSPPSVPVETLVEHLLAAKRALSSMTHVLRANELTTYARSLHEDSVILAAKTAFLRRGVQTQYYMLKRVRRGLARTYDGGKREFDRTVKTLDAAGDRLTRTMNMLKGTTVDAVFRPVGEEPRNLMDFVDEDNVDRLMNALMESITELKAAETSFDGDLLRFDNDLRAIKKLMTASYSTAKSHPSPSGSDSASYGPMAELVHSMTEQSHAMAEHLTSLTRHFDLCVTAVRTSEGGAALALRKAAEVGGSSVGGPDGGADDRDPVSISGVMAEQESLEGMRHLEPMSAGDRAEMVQVVTQDAAEVDGVVADMASGLAAMEADFALLRERAAAACLAYLAAAQSFRALDEVGGRLPSYVAAEREYADRCGAERAAIADRLAEVDALGLFYEGYAGAYAGLVLEAERRRAVEDRILAIWRKAAEGVDRLVETDRAARRGMQLEIGEYLPTDLWVGMNEPVRRWKVVPVAADDGADGPVAAAAVAGEGAGPSKASPSASAAGTAGESAAPLARQLKKRGGGGGVAGSAGAGDQSTSSLDKSGAPADNIAKEKRAGRGR